MKIKSNTIDRLKFNGIECSKIRFNGVVVWNNTTSEDATVLTEETENNTETE